MSSLPTEEALTARAFVVSGTLAVRAIALARLLGCEVASLGREATLLPPTIYRDLAEALQRSAPLRRFTPVGMSPDRGPEIYALLLRSAREASARRFVAAARAFRIAEQIAQDTAPAIRHGARERRESEQRRMAAHGARMRGGRPGRLDALGKVLRGILERNPRIHLEDVMGELEERKGRGVVLAVTGARRHGVVLWRAADGQTKRTSAHTVGNRVAALRSKRI